MLKSYTDLVHSTMASTAKDIDSITNEIRKVEESKLDVAKEVESQITEIVKKEAEERKKKIQEEADARKKSIEDAKNAYNDKNAEEDYNKELNKEQQKLLEIKSQITNIMKDTSASGKLKLQQLMEEAKGQQEVIDKMVLDHQRELNNKMYDEQINKIDEESKAKQDAIDKEYSDDKIAEKVKEALKTGMIETINGQMVTLRDYYIDWSNKYSDGLSIVGDKLQTEFLDKLTEAQDSAKNLNSILASLGISDVSGGGTGAFDNSQNLIGDIRNPVILPTSNILPNINFNSGVIGVGGALPSIKIESPLVNFAGNIDATTLPQVQELVDGAIETFKRMLTGQLNLKGIY